MLDRCAVAPFAVRRRSGPRGSARALAQLALAAVLGSGCGEEQPPEQWRIALEEVPGGVQHAYAERFAEEVEARTDGAVELSIYPFGALGEREAIYRQLQENAVHFAFGSADLARHVPESQAFHLHYVLSEDARVNAHALNDPELLRSDPLQAAYAEARLELLALVPEGWMAWSADRPLRRPADLEGLRVATGDHDLLHHTFRAYGAHATHLEPEEAVREAERGGIDVLAQPLFRHRELGSDEVHGHYTIARQTHYVASFMASSMFWDRISSERRGMLREIAAELAEWAHEEQASLNDEALSTLQSRSGVEVHELDAAEREAFRDRARPLRAVYTSLAGPRSEDILIRLLDAVERAEAEHGPAG